MKHQLIRNDMNALLIQKVKNADGKASGLSESLDKEKIPFQLISQVNWSEYPYKPDVKFRIAHNSKNILLNYRVEESDIKALCEEDNGKVWEDSCVEFFISFNEDDFYYNIESNCIGKIVVATGVDRYNRVPVPAAVINGIDRWSSLGNLPVENKSGKWELSLVIPVDVFLPSRINTFDGLQAKGNFYKCGDKLKVSHFLSWNPIKNDQPNFHLPQFFGKLVFD
ncbi:hypothetical protein EZS27_020937 [termite gut metagenome]|uniref:Carbohydrate-binding domain-containing protein n=1 Tax=termite gut metagenome TaxID=433724 RepID=A0A5J4RB23_9ZZZZ